MYIYDKEVKTKYGTYTYIYLAQSKRVNGKSKRVWEISLGRKDKIGENLSVLKRKLSKKIPKAEEFHFGMVYALFSICKEINLNELINRCIDKRKQGFSVGEYIMLLSINRAVALNSKSKLQKWFDKTALSRYFPNISSSLTSQNIWDQMGYLDQTTIRKIEALICKKSFSRYQLQSDCFLFDPTNFFTYIREYKKNTIAKRGYNKKKRYDLRQICSSLLVTLNECNVPIMHETYDGNINDVTHFKQVLILIEERLKAIGIKLAKITLVFDKGNNSKDAYKFLDSKHIHFVSSIRPSMKIAKKLLEIPLTKYEELWEKQNGRKVYGYRTTTYAYLGKDKEKEKEKEKENTAIVTFDEDTRALQEHDLDERIVKAISELEVFIETKVNIKPQWKDPKEVLIKINRDILKSKKLREIIVLSIEHVNNGLKLNITWKIDESKREECMKNFGKTIIFSNRNEWSMREIVKTYRAQIGVEQQFKELNKRDRLSVMPIYHWTDQKIRAHVFISVLALLLSNLLYRKLRLGHITHSKEECFEALKDIKEIRLYYDDDYPPDVTLTRLSALQRKLYRILNLKRFTKK